MPFVVSKLYVAAVVIILEGWIEPTPPMYE